MQNDWADQPGKPTQAAGGSRPFRLDFLAGSVGGRVGCVFFSSQIWLLVLVIITPFFFALRAWFPQFIDFDSIFEQPRRMQLDRFLRDPVACHKPDHRRSGRHPTLIRSSLK